MNFYKFPLGIRLGIAIIRIILFILVIPIAVILIFAGEREKSDRFMDWFKA